METKANRNAWRNNKGQGLVEFALVVPLLLLLVIGIAEFGRAWMTQNIMTGAVREAARIAVVQAPGGGWNGTAANARAIQILASAGIAATVSVPDPGIQYGDVIASVSYDFSRGDRRIHPGFGQRDDTALQHYDDATGILRKRGETIG